MSMIEQIQELSLHEKLHVMEAIWDEISREEAHLEMPAWHKDILDEREGLVHEGKAQYLDWEEARKQIEKATE